MKKVLAILMVSVLAVTSVFSVDIAIGAHSGFSQLAVLEENDSWNAIPAKVDAMFYFGDSFALNAAIGADFWISEDVSIALLKEGGMSVGLVADILAYYNLGLGDNMSLLIGGGASYHRVGNTSNEGSVKSSVNLDFLSLIGSVRFEFEATDNITAFAAVDVGYNIVNKMTVKISGTEINDSMPGNMEAKILPWAIKAGASYKF